MNLHNERYIANNNNAYTVYVVDEILPTLLRNRWKLYADINEIEN